MEQKTKSGFSLYVNSNENIQNALFLREKREKISYGIDHSVCGCMYMYNICISLSDISQDEGCKNDHKRADRIISVICI